MFPKLRQGQHKNSKIHEPIKNKTFFLNVICLSHIQHDSGVVVIYCFPFLNFLRFHDSLTIDITNDSMF